MLIAVVDLGDEGFEVIDFFEKLAFFLDIASDQFNHVIGPFELCESLALLFLGLGFLLGGSFRAFLNMNVGMVKLFCPPQGPFLCLLSTLCKFLRVLTFFSYFFNAKIPFLANGCYIKFHGCQSLFSVLQLLRYLPMLRFSGRLSKLCCGLRNGNI